MDAMNDDKTKQRVDRIADSFMGHGTSSTATTTKVMEVATKVIVGLIGVGLGALVLIMLWWLLGVILGYQFDRLWP